MFKVKKLPLVIKLSFDKDTLANEIKVLKTMEKTRSSKGVPRVIDYGLLKLSNFAEDKKP